ncbi:hypothetical protein KGF57_001288 [Candida theae]|uniref:Uncharacterized protein n=1 Tax=Candida theae TaxID=1198502 RepID=A0AAD5G026_9ASCO|nr:uncharacterized protein KGF57_001288 [Candida theae]KAI5963410.1 hypothetical protein KGF57_001288 [Candida theae]
MDRLIKVLQQPEVKNDLDEAYIVRLSKDLKRVQEHTKQADRAIRSFDNSLEASASLEKRIIALYVSYGNIPYTPDKNDTIATAATSVTLEEMVEEKKKEVSKCSEENATTEFDFTTEIAELKKQRATLLSQIEELSHLINREFKSPLPAKINESLELQKTLFSYLKKVLIKYLAISDRVLGSVNTKDQVKEKVRVLCNFFEALLTGQWMTLPEGVSTVVEILMRDGVLLHRDNQVKLRGFDGEI